MEKTAFVTHVVEEIEGNFHGGRTLLAIAESYRMLMQAISEYVQNPIDAGATRIRVIINRKNRDIVIEDNGDGIAREDFAKFMDEICFSQKSAGKYGKWGRGMVAAYGKCDWFTITSLPKGKDRGYLEWTFNTRHLLEQKQLRFPVKRRDDICIGIAQPRHGEKLVNWQTQIWIHKYTRDPVIGRISLDELEQRIGGNYAKALVERQIDLTITLVGEDGREQSRRVRGTEFRGFPLPEVALSDEDAGTTLFRLFQARKRGDGQVFVVEANDPYRLPFALFTDGARKHLPPEAAKSLTRGVFEGQIVSEKGKLHPNREQFEDSAALIGLCRHIAQWHKDVGAPFLEDLKDDARDERYKTAWLSTLRDVEGMLKSSMFIHLSDVVRSFKRGTIGEGHADIRLARLVETQETPSTAISGGAGGSRSSAPNPVKPAQPPANKNETPQDGVSTSHSNQDHTPLSVAVRGRRRRTVVRNDSLGLQISHEAPEDSAKLYQLDSRDGVLRINTRHPQWAQCEISDDTMLWLQKEIIVEALTIASLPEQWRETMEYYKERERPAAIFLRLQEAPSRSKPQPKTPRASRVVPRMA